MSDQTTGPPPAPTGPLLGGLVAHSLDRFTTEKPDRFATGCTYAVGAAAAIVSFSGWSGLASMAGYDQHATLDLFGWAVTVRMSYLFPFLVDAYAIGATRVWQLDRSITEETRTYAKWSALGATLLTIIALAGYHGLEVAGPPSGYWYVALAVAVGGIAPAMLGLALHLRSMCSKDAKTEPDHLTGPPTKPGKVDQPTKPDRTTKPKKPARPADKPVREQPTDRADLDLIRGKFPHRSPGRNEVMALLSCGTNKADRLLHLLAREEVKT